MNQRGKTVGFHLLGWALFFALVVAFVQGFKQDFSPLYTFSFLLFVVIYVALFYLNGFVFLPKLYLQRKYISYFLVSAVFLLLVFLIKPFDRMVMHNARPQQDVPGSFAPPPPPRGDFGPPPQQAPGRRSQDFDIVSIVLFLGIWSASSVLQIVRQWRTSERRVLQAEAEKMAAELSFLKAQINPHFLFNTLNNIYALAISKSEHTADAVLKLSAILHYVTDEVKEDVVPLANEVDCIQNFLALQQLRLTSKTTVIFLVEGSINSKTIAPLLLMTFIENAFKYGISNREPSKVEIRMKAEESSIHFYCQNQVFPRPAAIEREGIGINNAKKRLAYQYPNRFSLDINTQNDLYTVDLTIKT